MSLVRGRNFSVLLQKVKNKIQNDLTDHLSASQSVNEGISVGFKQSNQCFNALKCQKWAIGGIDRKFLMLAPGPPVSSQVFEFFEFFESKGRRRNNEDVRIYEQSERYEQSDQCLCALGCQKRLFNRSFSSQIFELMLAPGPPFFDRMFSSYAIFLSVETGSVVQDNKAVSRQR